MNKDDMSDDAEFAAFLKGEDDLSRRLQAMPQPEPPPELDAVIMKRVRFAQAQRAREAANDPGVRPEPRLGVGSGARWRVPVGIAASVLVGVLATQLYEGSARRSYEPSAEQAVMVRLPSQEEPQAPPPAVIVAQSDAMAPAPPPPPTAGLVASAARKPAVVAPSQSRDVPGLPLETPPPPPEMEVAAAPVAPAAAPVAAPAPAPAPAPVASYYAKSERAVGQVANQAEEAALQKRTDEVVSRMRVAKGLEPAAWVQKIEALLAAGKDAEALGEWEKFRKVNPYYLVPEAIQAKINAITR